MSVIRPIGSCLQTDADGYLVSESSVERSWLSDFHDRMRTRYDVHEGIEMGFTAIDPLLTSPDRRLARFTIKTQCACLHGEDLALQLPGFRPGAHLVGHARVIRRDIDNVKAELPDLSDPHQVKNLCQWIMKRVVRSGFELVMECDQTYTRDLYPGWQAFATHYPQQRADMEQALTWAIEPSADAAHVVAFLDGTGAWLADEIGDRLDLSN